MNESPTEHTEVIDRHLQRAIQKVTLAVQRYKSTDFWLLLVSIAAGALATLLAGGSASVGAPALEAFGGWRVLCFIVSGVTALSTLSAGLHKGFHVSDRLSDGRACLAKLQALDLDRQLSRRSLEDITEEYQELLTAYPGFLSE